MDDVGRTSTAADVVAGIDPTGQRITKNGGLLWDIR